MTRKRNIIDRTRRTRKRIQQLQETGGWPAVKEFMRRWPQCRRIDVAINQSAYAYTNAQDGIGKQTDAEVAADQLYRRMRGLIDADPEEYMEKRGPRWGRLAHKLDVEAEQLRSIWRRRKTADRK